MNSGIADVKMERNCRMCLAEDLKKSFQIFSYTLEDNLSVYDFYTNFTSINLRNQDERTKSKICLTCLKKLLTFYNDKCQAIANNEIISKWRDEGKMLPVLLKFFNHF